MLTLPITSLEQLERAEAHADLIEVMLERFPEKDLASLKEKSSRPLLFTLGKRGGEWDRFAHLKPDYVDFDWKTPPRTVTAKTIRSWDSEIQISS